jgi:hypothetical protein
LTPEDYVKRNEPFFAKEGFYEKEMARRTEVYGNHRARFFDLRIISQPFGQKTVRARHQQFPAS